MTDTRFKWLIIAGSVTIVLVTALICFPKIYRTVHKSESRRAEKSEYVFVDGYGILHTNPKCTRLNYKGLPSGRIKKDALTQFDYDTFCPKCVSSEDYERLNHHQ